MNGVRNYLEKKENKNGGIIYFRFYYYYFSIRVKKDHFSMPMGCLKKKWDGGSNNPKLNLRKSHFGNF